MEATAKAEEEAKLQLSHVHSNVETVGRQARVQP